MNKVIYVTLPKGMVSDGCQGTSSSVRFYIHALLDQQLHHVGSRDARLYMWLWLCMAVALHVAGFGWMWLWLAVALAGFGWLAMALAGWLWL